MKISREFDFNGTRLQVHGKYKNGSPSVEGSISEPATFEISEILDISLSKKLKIVTDLYSDFFEEIEQIVISIIGQEDPEDYYVGDATLDLGGIEDIFTSMSQMSLEGPPKPRMPVKFDGIDGDFHNLLTITKLLSDLVLEISEPEDPIIACKVSHEQIKFVKLSEV